MCKIPSLISTLHHLMETTASECTYCTNRRTFSRPHVCSIKHVLGVSPGELASRLELDASKTFCSEMSRAFLLLSEVCYFLKCHGHGKNPLDHPFLSLLSTHTPSPEGVERGQFNRVFHEGLIFSFLSRDTADQIRTHCEFEEFKG